MEQHNKGKEKSAILVWNLSFKYKLVSLNNLICIRIIFSYFLSAFVLLLVLFVQLLDVGNDNLVSKCGAEGYTPLHFAVGFFCVIIFE